MPRLHRPASWPAVSPQAPKHRPRYMNVTNSSNTQLSAIPTLYLHTSIFIHQLIIIIIIIIIIIKAICNAQDPTRRPQMRCLAVRECSCLYTMYHMNNNVFSSVLKVVRLQSDTQWASYSTQKVRIQQSFYLHSLCLSVE